MEIKQAEFGDVTVLTLRGMNTMGGGARFLSERLIELLKSGKRKFVVVFENVTYQDSFGIATLVKAFAMTRNAGGELVLAGVRGRVEETFQFTRLQSVFAMFATVPEALAHFGVNPTT